MIEIYKFERFGEEEGYTLLVVETKNFHPLDIEKIKTRYPEVDATKGVALSGAPETDWTVIADLYSHYRDRSVWVGAYNPSPKTLGIVVGSARPISGRVRGEAIPAQLPCLECFRTQREDCLVKPGSKYPYCEEHYAKSPHRSGSRRKKSAA
jgi:hypothetical protein